MDSSPKFSFGLKPAVEKPNDTPGPHNKLLITCLKKLQLVSSSIKCYNYHIYLFLAPGTYSPEKVNLDKGPQYSLSGKGSVEKPLDTPGI